MTHVRAYFYEYFINLTVQLIRDYNFRNLQRGPHYSAMAIISTSKADKQKERIRLQWTYEENLSSIFINTRVHIISVSYVA